MKKHILAGRIGYRTWDGEVDCFGRKIYSCLCKCGNEFQIKDEIVYKAKDESKSENSYNQQVSLFYLWTGGVLSQNNVIFSTFKLRTKN